MPTDNTLSRALAEYASPQVVERGMAYFHARRVRSVSVEKNVVSAVVHGTYPYDVEIELSGGAIYAGCTCPAMKHAGMCKHAYALAAHFDAMGGTKELMGVGSTAEPSRTPPELPPDAWPSTLPAEHGAPHTSRPHDWRERLSWIRSRLPDPPWQEASQESSRTSLWEVVVRAKTDYGFPVDLWRIPQRADGSPGERARAHWNRLRTYSTMPHKIRRALEQVVLSGGLPWHLRTNAVAHVDMPHLGRLLAAAKAGVDVYVVPAGKKEPVGPVEYDSRGWRVGARIKLDPEKGEVVVLGTLLRSDEVLVVEEPVALRAGADVVVIGTQALQITNDASDAWVRSLLEHGPLRAPATSIDQVLLALRGRDSDIALELRGFTEEPLSVTARLVLGQPTPTGIPAQPQFEYADQTVPVAGKDIIVALSASGDALVRSPAEEQRLLAALETAGVETIRPLDKPQPLRVPPSGLAEHLGQVIAAGWLVELDGRAVRGSGKLGQLSVRSGVDWFDLEGRATFDEAHVALPAILAAARAGRQLVELDDGSHAVLPSAWMARLESLARISDGTGKVARARALLLDDVLTNFEDVGTDMDFAATRKTLARFDGLGPRSAPAAFKGVLRPYQEEGLGWLDFLVQSGLGGCLADDMGLGKTVQVLAHLVRRKRARARRGPFLVVAPRSVIGNWCRESERFTPTLRTAIYHGAGRKALLEDPSRLDLLVTTYGTLRVDIETLAAVPFDHVVLDEAQAIKNPTSKVARAARRLDTQHRLALSGTPIENRLGDLASLFAFLAPGLLGGERDLMELVGGTRGEPSAKGLERLQRALRPVVLRRTKAEVLPDLPSKTEQVIRCELPAAQKKSYERIREHFRSSLLTRVEERGLAKSKIHVLEALLRLRQAACHPALLDPAAGDQPCAKFDVLLPMIDDLVAEGHKALVFSQFTSYLALLRQELDARGVRYEYLDGRTRKREARVAAFQDDPETPLFLISLKAGGTGLNLTAADYVFLLDPWWNPATEAQAIDRTHRIGQKRSVLVYRLIGAGTVEEKVLELQDRKRALVQSVLGGIADAPLRGLDLSDLDALLT